MKKYLFLYFILSYSIFYSQLNNGLKAHYLFNGNVNDNSGQSHHGQIIGNLNLVDDRFGIPNSAYQFPGDATNYISINYADDFNIAPTESFSISLWYKGGSSIPGDFEVLFGKENHQINYKPYDYFIALYDGNRVFCGGSGFEVLWSPITPPQSDPNWHYVVFMYENKNWYLYQDNVLTKSNTNQTSAISQSVDGLVIGKSFQGIIDDVRFYNRKLSENEIDELYKLNNLEIIENSGNMGIKIFPNPATDNIHINYALQNTQIMLFSGEGKKIPVKTRIDYDKTVLDISKLTKGVYYLDLNFNGKHIKKSFIKN